jgi:potassium efflux system protein
MVNSIRTLAILFLLLMVPHAGSQDTAAPDVPTIESVRAALDALGESESASGELYREAITQLERAAQARARTEEAQRGIAEAPRLLETIKAELSAPTNGVQPEVPKDATLSQLEQGLAQTNAELAAARTLVGELTAESNRRQERRTQIPDALARSRQQLGEIEDAIGALSPGVDPAVPVEARRTLLLAQRKAVVDEIAALETELANYEARRELLPARLERATRRVATLESLTKAWQELVAERRKLEAQQSAEEAAKLRRDAARQHPALQEYAAANQSLAEQRAAQDGIPQRIDRVSRGVLDARSRLEQVHGDFAEVVARLEKSGLNRATGLLLRRQLGSLPNVDGLRIDVKKNERELEDAEYTLIKRKGDLKDFPGVDAVVSGLIERITESDRRQEPEPNAGGPVASRAAELELVAGELARARVKLLGEMVSDAEKLLEQLYEYDEVKRELLEESTVYRNIISERILWVPSIPENRPPSVSELRDALAWLTAPEAWRAAVSALAETINARKTLFISSTGLVLMSFVVWHLCRVRIRRTAELVARFSTDSYAHTLKVLVWTLLAAMPLPALLWWAGWWITAPAQQPDVALAFGAGLRYVGLLLYPLLVLRLTVLRGGLGGAHFRWTESALSVIRTHLAWFIPFGTAAAVLLRAIHTHADEVILASLGRIAFTCAMIAVSSVIHLFLRPSGPVLAEHVRKNPTSFVARTRLVWYPILVGIPILMIALAWAGYFHTATELNRRMLQTLVLILVFVLLNALLMRWLFVTKRRVAVEEAMRRREQALADEKKGADAPVESVIPQVNADEIDLGAISLQTRQLFRVVVVISAILGLYAVWAEVLPALRMLDNVQVYPEWRVVDASVEAELAAREADVAPDAETPTPESAVGLVGTPDLTASPTPPSDESAALTVSLSDVGLSIVLLIGTLAAFRNLPGLVEIAVLQRLPLDAGSRYAIATVIRYLIAIVGIAAAFGAVGLTWERVQWLAAALTFGLAFGLQEIFANFVSGLIILAERPVRIGDTVTVGTTSGTVTQIRMRATTITDWDRKELVIPNKQFITGDVINWTLTEPSLRVTIPVGVSYSADVRKAEAVLLRVAQEQANVMTDPKPYVYFNGFGDSTLSFELRFFIPHIEHLITVKHALYMRITEAFRQEGIEIAFPQRDLHIRSMPAGLGNAAEATGGGIMTARE